VGAEAPSKQTGSPQGASGGEHQSSRRGGGRGAGGGRWLRASLSVQTAEQWESLSCGQALRRM